MITIMVNNIQYSLWNDTNLPIINPVIKVMVNRMEYLKIVDEKLRFWVKVLNG
jgi:hypothetical protein